MDPFNLENEKPDDQVRQNEVLDEFRKRLKTSRSHFAEWRREAKSLYEFVAGNQWEDEDAENMREAQRPMVTFNLASKFIDAVVGLQINNRQEIRYFPRELGDVGVNDLATGAIKWNRDLSDAEDEETDAFYDLVLVGMGYIEHRIEDTTTPEGFIAQERRDPLEMYPDPAARKRNLTDARYIIRLVPYTRDAYEERFGEAPGSQGGGGLFELDQDAEIQVIREPQDYDDDEVGEAKTRNLTIVGQYQFWELETRYFVQAEGLGGKEFSAEEWQAIEPRLKQQQIPYEARSIQQRCYYQAIIDGGKVRELVKLPTSSFTFMAMTGKRERNKRTWYGLGRNIKDPNLWVNKFFSTILWILAVNPKGGLLAERDAFDKPAQAEESWANPSKITFTAPGAITEGKIKEKPAANYPPGIDRLMDFSLRALPETSGLNLELLGLADREQAGVVEAQRKQSAMAIIAWAFDAMRRYHKESGRLMLELVRQYMADGRLVRIAGQAGEQYVPLLKDELTSTYDIVVDEAPTSTNMRERVWAVLRDVLPVALQSGIKVPPEVMDYAPLPEDLAQKWRKSLQPSPEQQQQQQQQVELMVREAMAKIHKEESAALLNEAKAAEINQTTPAKAAQAAAQAVKTGAEAGAVQAGTAK